MRVRLCLRVRAQAAAMLFQIRFSCTWKILGRICLQTCISHTQYCVDGFQQQNLLHISVNLKPQITFSLNAGQQC